MAVTVINLSDPVSTLVTKINTISGDVGDVAQLTTGDSNVVDAINTLKTTIEPFDDSAEIAAIARGALSVNNAAVNGVNGTTLDYNAGTGVMSILGGIDSAEIINVSRGALSVNNASVKGTT